MIEQMDSPERELALFLDVFEPCFLQDRTFDHPGKRALGRLSDVPRKSIEPITLAAGVSAHPLPAFLSRFRWDHERADTLLKRMVVTTPFRAASHALYLDYFHISHNEDACDLIGDPISVQSSPNRA